MNFFAYVFISFVFVLSECRNINYMKENSSFEDIVSSSNASSRQGQTIFMNKLKDYVENDSVNESKTMGRTINRDDLSEHAKSEYSESENSSFEAAIKDGTSARQGQLIFVDKPKQFSKSEVEHETKNAGRMIPKDDLGKLVKSDLVASENSSMESEKNFMDLLSEDVIGIEMHSNGRNYSLVHRPNRVLIGENPSFEAVSVSPAESVFDKVHNSDKKHINISSGELDKIARNGNISCRVMDVLEVTENNTKTNLTGVISLPKESRRRDDLEVMKNRTKAKTTGVIIFPGESQRPMEDANGSAEVNVTEVDLSNRQTFDVPVLCKEGYAKDMFGECVEIFE